MLHEDAEIGVHSICELGVLVLEQCLAHFKPLDRLIVEVLEVSPVGLIFFFGLLALLPQQIRFGGQTEDPVNGIDSSLYVGSDLLYDDYAV